jgi:hypothetical protein
MLFEKFLNLIDHTFIGSIIGKKMDIIENTDPDRIYVENIRAFYNLPFSAAKTFCEIAVRENIFKKKIALFCPNDDCRRVIKSYDAAEKQDETVICLQCQLKENDNFCFETKNLKKEIFYQLQD